MLTGKSSRLSFASTILVAGTLFGMFFGAGNLIFPVHLGQLAGSNMWSAAAGFILTAVGIPILGVAAIGITHSDGLQALASKIGTGYGKCFTCLLYLTIGPFFAIPRCCTASFTTGIAPILGEGTGQTLPLTVFSALFFGLVLFFSLKPGKITVWIGKIINPVFLVFFFILAVAVWVQPGADRQAVLPAAGYETGAFFSALIEGYGTMDAIAGLAFGIVVIRIIRGMGVTEDGAVAADVLRSGVFTGILMAAIYLLTIVMGVRSRAFFETSANGGIALTQIASHYLGNAGGVVLALTIIFACLKTSIGLVTGCAETFVKMFPKSLSYRGWAILLSVFSFAVSNVGLSAIINCSLPVLMFLYPLTITLILLALTGKLFDHDRTVYVSVTAFTLVAALMDFIKNLPASVIDTLKLNGVIALGGKLLPWFDLNLGWVVPALIGFAVGIIIRRIKSKLSC